MKAFGLHDADRNAHMGRLPENPPREKLSACIKAFLKMDSDVIVNAKESGL